MAAWADAGILIAGCHDQLLGGYGETLRGSAHFGWFSTNGRDQDAPALPLGQAPSDRGRQRPPRPRRLIPCHPVSPVAPPGSAEPCRCYIFCYTPETPKALFLVGKGP
jgi:hypothetical protein